MRTVKRLSSKKSIDFKIPYSQKKKIENAVNTILSFYQPKLEELADLPLEKRMMAIELNPRLKSLLKPFLEFLGVS